MVHLNKIPAFGFETSKCEASLAHVKAANCSPVIKKMGLNKMSTAFHTFSTNVAKVAGYIPGLSIIVGIGRLITFLKDRNGCYSKHHVFRALLETANLGFLFMIPDILVTIARHKKPQGCKKIHAQHISVPKFKEPSMQFAHKVEEFIGNQKISPQAKKNLNAVNKGVCKLGGALGHTAKDAWKHFNQIATN